MKNYRRFILITLVFMMGSLSAQEFPDSLTQDIFDKLETNYYNDNEISFDNPNPKNLHYRVKVGSFTQEVNTKFFNNFYPVSALSYQSGNRYYIGLFTHYQNAELAREYLESSGFEGAFLVAFNHGKEISLSKAIDMEQVYFLSAPSPTTKVINDDVRVVMTPIPSTKKNSCCSRFF